jgi:hypothetical protein
MKMQAQINVVYLFSFILFAASLAVVFGVGSDYPAPLRAIAVTLAVICFRGCGILSRLCQKVERLEATVRNGWKVGQVVSPDNVS